MSHYMLLPGGDDIFRSCCASERQNHARELIREISLHEWDGVVIVSGDGLLHEVLSVSVFTNSIPSKVDASMPVIGR